MLRVHGDVYTPVSEFYEGKSVFITGVTGFSGQCLVEKLLRSCPGIGKVYIPIRTKRGVDASQRFRKFLNNSVFDRLRESSPDFAANLVPLYGNLEESNLGLSDELFEKLTNEVSIIFHIAALIRLDPLLSEAVRDNILVSTNVVRFGKQCKHLEAYIHTSTLYVHNDRDFTGEKVYPTEWTHDQLIDLMNNGRLKQHKKAIIGTSPTIYLATKKVCEYLTKLEGGSIPAAIVRPGKISPSLREPIQGWSYGIGTYIPWMKQVEKGTMRFMPGRPEIENEVIPVDLFANSLIVTGWYLGTGQYRDQQLDEPLVVNLHSKCYRPTMQEFVDHVNQYFIEQGRSPKVTLYPSRLKLFLRFGIPTACGYFRQRIKGQLPVNFYIFMLALSNGAYSANVLNNPKEYTNLDKIEKSLSEVDKKEFSVDFNQVNWKEYTITWLTTLREQREVKEKREAEKKMKASRIIQSHRL